MCNENKAAFNGPQLDGEVSKRLPKKKVTLYEGSSMAVEFSDADGNINGAMMEGTVRRIHSVGMDSCIVLEDVHTGDTITISLI